MLDVVLLVVCIAIVFGFILYVFFFNRVIGFIAGIILRLVLWTQNSASAWVDFESVHVSLIAGRLLLRNVRYHSSDETFHIVKCLISWRWWLRNIAENEDLDTVGEGEGIRNKVDAPLCRIHISLDGFEWFIYNRTSTFDAILSQLGSVDPTITTSKTENRESYTSFAHDIVGRGINSRFYFLSVARRVLSVLRMPPLFSGMSRIIKRQLPDFDPNNLFPISLEASKGAIILGNHSTENLLLAQYSRAEGTFGIIQARSMLDLHRQSLRVVFQDTSIGLVENMDYWGTIRNIAMDMHVCLRKSARSTVPLSFPDFVKVWERCRSHFPFFRPRSKAYIRPGMDLNKKGAGQDKKRREDVSHVGADFTILEYAVDRKLLEASQLELTYYADVPGTVPEGADLVFDENRNEASKNLEFIDVGNGDLPPEWGIETVVHGATIHYGPWADRQRVQLQHAFFPPSFQNGTPMEVLRPGDKRRCTCLKLFIEFRGATALHIPFREASKDWQWDGQTDVFREGKQRESASIQLRACEKTSVKYLVPMIATTKGYVADLDVYLDGISVTSSLNDIQLLEATSCSISANPPAPLLWNAERCWSFNINLDNPKLFLIRDHVNMLIDLSKDWSSGPPSDFHNFVPITYKVCLRLKDYELNLYANDRNVIDRPLEKGENALFVLSGDALVNNITIPLNKFRPLTTTISFSVDAPNIDVGLMLPRWNTHVLSTSSVDWPARIGVFPVLDLNGSFTYYSEIREEFVDRLKLDIKFSSLSLKLPGWVIRLVMALRENYVGKSTHYSTTREYLDKHQKGLNTSDPIDLKYRPNKNNTFHFDLGILTENSAIYIPAGWSFQESVNSNETEQHDRNKIQHIAISIPELQMDLRLHEYFMEMSLNVGPFYLSTKALIANACLMHNECLSSQRQLSISSLAIVVKGLFGPQPRATTYAYIWEIRAGRCISFLTIEDLRILVLAVRSFAHGFVDPFNAPAAEFVQEPEHDTTLLKLTLDDVDISCQADSSMIRIGLHEGLLISFNSLAQTHYRKLSSIVVPAIHVQLLIAPDSHKGHWMEAGFIRSSIFSNLYKAPKRWRRDAEEQERLLKKEDAPTGRLSGLVRTVNNPRISQISFSNRVERHKKWHILDDSISNAPYSTASKSVKTESDDAPSICELDRDQRLADSKPEALRQDHVESDEQYSSSAFDESDENETIPTADSWSDIFDLCGDDARSRECLRYSRFCRKYRYSKDQEGNPVFLGGNETPFIQQEKLLFRKNRRPPTYDKMDKIQGNVNAGGWMMSDAINREYNALHLKDTVIFWTPIAIFALGDMISSSNEDARSAETRLDELMLDWMSMTPDEILSAYDVTVETAHLCAIWETDCSTVFHESPAIFQRQEQSIIEKNLLIIDLRCDDARVLAGNPINRESLSPDGSVWHGKMSTRTFSVTLRADNMPLHARIDASHTPELILDLDLLSYCAILSGSKFDLSYENSRLHLGQFSPEVAVVFADIMKNLIQDLTDVVKIVQTKKAQQRHLVHCILRNISDIQPKDLFSAVQPSFFVQRGLPNRLRQDNTWRFLFCLRHALSGTSGERFQSLKEDLHKPFQQKNGSYLSALSRAVPWAVEEDLPATERELLRGLFSSFDKRVAQQVNRSPLRFVGFRAGSITVIVDDFDYPQSGKFIVGGIGIRADILERQIVLDDQGITTPRNPKPVGKHVDGINFGILISASVNTVGVTVYPGFVSFIHRVLTFWKASSQKENKPETSTSAVEGSLLRNCINDKLILCDVRIVIKELLVEVAAENTIFEVATQDLSFYSTGQISKSPINAGMIDISINHSMRFKEFNIKTMSLVIAEGKERSAHQLAGVIITGGLMTLMFSKHTSHGFSSRSAIHADFVEFCVPRSGIRLYQSIEQWRQDYLKVLNAVMNSFYAELRELRQGPRASSQHSRPKGTRGISLDLNATISRAGVALQVMHGTWLAWNSHAIVACMKVKRAGQKLHDAGGLQIGSHSIRIISDVPTGESVKSRIPKIVIGLPSISASISFAKDAMDVLVSVGIWHLTIKPLHLDTLLSVQQKFGQDFNDLLQIVDQSRSGYSELSTFSSEPPRSLSYTVAGRLDGFSIGLEGHSTTQILECEDIDVIISNVDRIHWQFNLSDLEIFLAPNSLLEHRRRRSKFDRNQLPVMISIDFQAAMARLSPGKEPLKHLDVKITRFHATSQTSMISEVGDFIDYLQAEVMLRQEQRAFELREFKEKARKAMKAFNVIPRSSKLSNGGTLLESYVVSVSMTNFGIAFPLETERTISHKFGVGDVCTSKAFLLCIKLLNFQSQRNEMGEAKMTGFSFQFISSFDPSEPENFIADRHATLNRMVYPEMTAGLKSKTTSSTRNIHISSTISGFILDLDPSVAVHIFAMVDAYRRGRQHMEHFALGMQRNVPETSLVLTSTDKTREGQQGSTISTRIEVNLKFMSGNVRLHPSAKEVPMSSAWVGAREAYRFLDPETEVFSLPELSVRCDYIADAHVFESTPTSQDMLNPVFIFQSTVHSSCNTFNPSVLPFISGIVHGIEDRMRRAPSDLASSFPPGVHASASGTSAEDQSFSSIFQQQLPGSSSLQLVFSLRIDKSQLELSCKPDVNVVAGLHWDSGGFIVNLCPGRSRATVSASVDGLTARLKHGFLSESSAHLDVKNLNFSANFSKGISRLGQYVNTISAVVDTEFSGSIRFSRLQDFLCFKAVWLDNIPIINNNVADSPPPASSSANVSHIPSSKQGVFDTAVLIRVRHIILEADLGQSISTVTSELRTAITKIRFTPEYTGLALSFSTVDMQAKGNLSGYLKMPEFDFRTVRRHRVSGLNNKSLSRMLEVYFESGPLDIQLESDRLWILQYCAEPLKALIYDDWPNGESVDSDPGHGLDLHFSVTGSKITAMMTIMAIPKLILYYGKFRANLEAQREGASHESSTFRSKRLTKPGSALSEVANALFQSARTKLKETETPSYAIDQHMKLNLHELVFVLLPRYSNDNEMARFVAKGVSAVLDRNVQDDGHPLHRDLQLSLSHISISQLMKQEPVYSLLEQTVDVSALNLLSTASTENLIFSLPAMNMHMITDEIHEDMARVLLYEFESRFERRGLKRGTENIHISFNISLYSWLTVLRKTFTRELRRAKEISEWQSGNAISSATQLISPTISDNGTSPTTRIGEQARSRLQSRRPSRPSSPVRSRSVESVRTTGQGPPQAKAPTLSPSRSGSGESSKRGRLMIRTTSTSDKHPEKTSIEEAPPISKTSKVVYRPQKRNIERLTVRQLGEATPDVMHPFFTKKAGFNLEEALPQYVHEYATLPIEEIIKALVQIYSKQVS